MTFFTVATYAFVPWVVVLFALSFAIYLPRSLFITVHYFLDVFLFGFVFHYFFETHPHASAFTTTTLALIALFIFELIFLNFFSSDPGRFLNYVDWIFPAFLIATSIYVVGKKG